jgi:hypothetical protein
LKLHEIAPAVLTIKDVPREARYNPDTARTRIGQQALRRSVGAPKAPPLKQHGSGIAGTAFSKERLPQEVRKVGSGFGTPENHGYLLFVQLALQMQHNPHFPKIYKAKAHKYKESSLGFVIDMEPLVHGGTVPEEHMRVVLERYLGFTDEDIAEQREGSLYYRFAERLDRILQYPETYQEFMQKSQDEEFKEAVTALRKLMVDKRLMVDMHTGNVMYRTSQYGYVPVIIDPYG